MLTRLVTGFIVGPAVLVAVFWPGGLPFAVVVGVFSVVGAMEFYKGVRKTGARPVEWAGLLAVVMFVVSMRTYQRSTIGAVFPAVLTLLLILSFLHELLRTRRAPLLNVGLTVFGAIYVGWLISHLVVLREIGGAVSIGSFTTTAGACLVTYALLCTWACDTGAYFIGKFYGRKRLAPMLSPNKTVEGSVAGVVSSIVVSGILATVIDLPGAHWLALGAIFGVLSQMGDLSESAIKRELSVKDFGHIMPGHGGILDRIDSLLFTGPVAYYYVVLFLQGWPKHL